MHICTHWETSFKQQLLCTFSLVQSGFCSFYSCLRTEMKVFLFFAFRLIFTSKIVLQFNKVLSSTYFLASCSQCPTLSFMRYRPAGPATSSSSRPCWKVPGPQNHYGKSAFAYILKLHTLIMWTTPKMQRASWTCSTTSHSKFDC